MAKTLPRLLTTVLKFVGKDPTQETLCGIMFDRARGVILATDAFRAIFVKCDNPFYYAEILAEAKGLPKPSMEVAGGYFRTMRENRETNKWEPEKNTYNDGLPDCVVIANVGKKNGGWKYVTVPYPSIFNTIPFGMHSDLDEVTAYYDGELMGNVIKSFETFTGVPVTLHTSKNRIDGPLIHYAKKGALEAALVIMPKRYDMADPEIGENWVKVAPCKAPENSLVKTWTDMAKNF